MFKRSNATTRQAARQEAYREADAYMSTGRNHSPMPRETSPHIADTRPRATVSQLQPQPQKQPYTPPKSVQRRAASGSR